VLLTRYNRMVLRMIPAPFFGWIGMLVFVLIMQFLIKYMKLLVGKGLAASIIMELLTFSLAYMLALAVPMSVLIATLMTFARFAESKSYAVVKASGVSYMQLVWPALAVGLAVMGGMFYFNNVVLPEANFRARMLWSDIRKSKPGFEIQSGEFYEGISDYAILVGNVPAGATRLNDVSIFDYTDGTSSDRSEIKAEAGFIEPIGNGTRQRVVLVNGELHKYRPGRRGEEERYEVLRFGRHEFVIDLAEFAFQRSDLSEGRRSDRTMQTRLMKFVVDSLESTAASEIQELRVAGRAAVHPPVAPPIDASSLDVTSGDPAVVPLGGASARGLIGALDETSARLVYGEAAQNARAFRTEIDNARRSVSWKLSRADKYRVEIHKKYSMAVACLIFVLIGAPLGLSIQRGGLGVAGTLAVAIFLFYWITLVQGEKLSDRGLLEPWIGMWIANAVTFLIATWLSVRVSFDLHATPRFRDRFRRFRTS
jgi:lipopolysaccharide export system permease protein